MNKILIVLWLSLIVLSACKKETAQAKFNNYVKKYEKNPDKMDKAKFLELADKAEKEYKKSDEFLQFSCSTEKHMEELEKEIYEKSGKKYGFKMSPECIDYFKRVKKNN